MEGKMKVAVMNGIGKMGYTTRDIPTPKDDEVLVKLEYVGICGIFGTFIYSVHHDLCHRYLRSSKQNLTRTRPPCKIAST